MGNMVCQIKLMGMKPCWNIAILWVNIVRQIGRSYVREYSLVIWVWLENIFCSRFQWKGNFMLLKIKKIIMKENQWVRIGGNL